MTKQRIEQYINLKREIAMLEEQICTAECSGGLISDTVKGSMNEIPYAVHSVTIQGYTSQHAPKLRKRKATLEVECAAIEKYIDAIKDSIMRQLLVRRYLEGRTVDEAAKLVGYSQRQAIRLINAHFKRCHLMSPDVT